MQSGSHCECFRWEDWAVPPARSDTSRCEGSSPDACVELLGWAPGTEVHEGEPEPAGVCQFAASEAGGTSVRCCRDGFPAAFAFEFPTRCASVMRGQGSILCLDERGQLDSQVYLDGEVRPFDRPISP